jgi:predicted kinase/CRISPR/Cas system-associated endonuclease Cas3-HD
MNFYQMFDEIYEDFKSSIYAHQMLLTREDSPWHREDNVMEHTRMCLSWYDNNLKSKRNEFQHFLTKMAILFHDTGKPRARTEKYSESRGTYFDYPGHEQISAMMFMNYIAEKKLEKFKPIEQLSLRDISFIRFMIQFHLPYEFNIKKIAEVKKHIIVNYTSELNFVCFTDLILSDAHGRISDDMEAKIERVDSWVEKFKMLQYQQDVYIPKKENQPILHVLIGASGNGKSSYIEKYKTEDDVHFGLDLMREKFYIEKNNKSSSYSDYFNFCIENQKEFDQYSLKEFISLIKSNKSIFLDNTNCTTKSRRKWIEEAKRHGYLIKGIELISPVSVLVERQSTRGDKNVPEKSVMNQYFKCAMPLVPSEVEEYTLIMNNGE